MRIFSSYKKYVGTHKDCGGDIRFAISKNKSISVYYCQTCWHNTIVHTLDIDKDILWARNTDNLPQTQNSALGVSFPTNDPLNYPKLKNAGVKYTRLDCNWDDREPSKGNLAWAGLDSRLNGAQEQDLDVMLTLVCNASWGVTNQGNTAKNQPPTDLADWTNFVQAVTTRYTLGNPETPSWLTSSVTYYNFPNEWTSTSNSNGGWGGTKAELATVFNATYDVIKAINPSAKVSIGGIATGSADAFAAALNYSNKDVIISYDATYTQAQIQADSAFMTKTTDVTNLYKSITADQVDIHLYSTVDRDADKITMMTDFKNYCGASEIICTEFGGPSLYFETSTDTKLFMNAVERFMYFKAVGIKLPMWFALAAPNASESVINVPLFDAEGKARPQYYALYLLAKALNNASMIIKLSDNIYSIIKGADAHYIAWKSGASTTLTVSGSVTETEYIRIIDPQTGFYKTELLPDDRIIQLSELPIYI